MAQPVHVADSYQARVRGSAPYDNADKARLPQMTLHINGGYRKKPNAHARVIHDAYWYANGSTMGSVTHEQFNYAIQGVPGYRALTTPARSISFPDRVVL